VSNNELHQELFDSWISLILMQVSWSLILLWLNMFLVPQVWVKFGNQSLFETFNQFNPLSLEMHEFSHFN